MSFSGVPDQGAASATAHDSAIVATILFTAIILASSAPARCTKESAGGGRQPRLRLPRQPQIVFDLVDLFFQYPRRRTPRLGLFQFLLRIGQPLLKPHHLRAGLRQRLLHPRRRMLFLAPRLRLSTLLGLRLGGSLVPRSRDRRYRLQRAAD